jgi:hypothetical protein
MRNRSQNLDLSFRIRDAFRKKVNIISKNQGLAVNSTLILSPSFTSNSLARPAASSIT